MSLLGKSPIAQLTCSVPPAGAWWATVALEGKAAPALGATTLTIGDLTLAGSVVLTGEEAPGSPRAVLHGGPGWWRSVARGESWQSDSGVKLETVLKALQKATREALVMPDDASLGSTFGWPAASTFAPLTYGDVLGGLVRRRALPTWRVAADGSTRFDAWPALGAADSMGRVLRRKLDVGLRVLGLDTRVASFLPGATVDGGVPVARVTFRETAERLEAEVWQR